MFRGVTAINMDAKGRIAMPSKYRGGLVEACDGKMVATIHLVSKCLLIYPLPVWEAIERELQELPTLKREVARIQRLVLGYASDIEQDGSGRVLLPSSLREHAGLDKKVVLVGQGKKFELWDETLWDEETDEARAQTKEQSMPEEVISISF